MGIVDHPHELDEAIGRIEEAILPSIAMMLETMLDAADHARPGNDARACAVELRMLALQLEAVTRQMDEIAPHHAPPSKRQDVARA